MKPATILSVCLALVAGIFLGSWGTRQQATRLKEENQRLKETADQRGASPADLSREVTGLLGIRAAAQSTPKDTHPHEPAQTSRTSTNTAPPTPGPGQPPPEELRSAASETEFSSDLEEQIATAAELWTTRADIARANFAANADLSNEELVQFDVVITAMNLRFEEQIKQAAERIKAAETIGQEDGVRLVNELTGTLVTAYDDLDQRMPDGWRGEAGEFDLTTHIDPMVAMPLVDVQDRFESRGRRLVR